MIQDGGETGEALGGRYSPARAALRLCLTSLTVAATLYLIIKSGCRDLPDACARASAYVPGWAYALEPIARQFAPYVDFVGAGFKSGWKVARPELESAWKEAEPSFAAAAASVDNVLEGWKPWQVVAMSSICSAAFLWVVSSFVEWLHEVNQAGLLGYLLRVAKCFPGVQWLINRQLAEVGREMWQSVSSKGIPEEDPPLVSLPPQGIDDKRLKDWLQQKAAASDPSSAGRSRMSGAVYFPTSERHAELLQAAYTAFTPANPLHADAFPSVRRMEAEVVSMTASLLGGGNQGANRHVCGLMTSGGTESILSAVKASRDFVMSLRRIKRPEIIVASSAHPAYFKAASYFGLQLVKLPVDKKTFRLTAASVKAALGRDTVLVVASAPCYPHGVVDEVAGIAAAAMNAHVLCHVDACLGGFVLPFARKLGRQVPDFDFSVPGVTSMSVDTHKFGLAHKGTSVVLFAGPRLRAKLYTAVTEWSGGPYISPGFPGSRSGALIATAWTSLAMMGCEGFMDVTKGIMQLADAFCIGLQKISDLEVMGQPEMSVIAFRSTSNRLNIYQLNDLLCKLGWKLSALHLPPALHMCWTAAHTMETVEKLLADISECRHALLSGHASPKGGSAKLYGMSSSLPDRKLVGDILEIYQDIQLAIY